MEKRQIWVSLLLILLAGWYVNNAQIFSPELTGSAIRNRSTRQTATLEIQESSSSSQPLAMTGGGSTQQPDTSYNIVKKHLDSIDRKVRIYQKLLELDAKTGKLGQVAKLAICNNLMILRVYLGFLSFELDSAFGNDPYGIMLHNMLLQEMNDIDFRIEELLSKYCSDIMPKWRDTMNTMLRNIRKIPITDIEKLIEDIVEEIPGNPAYNVYIEQPKTPPITEPCLPPVQGWNPVEYPYITFMPPCASQYMDTVVATACGVIAARLSLTATTSMATGTAIVANSGKVISMASYVNRLRQLQQAAAAAAITPDMINQVIMEMQANPQQFEQINNPANQANPAVDCDPPITPNSTPSTDGTASQPVATTPTHSTKTPPCTQSFDFNRVKLQVSDWKGLDNNGGWFSGPPTEHYVTADVEMIVPEDMAHAMADDLTNGFGGTLVVSSASQQGIGHLRWEPQQIGAGGNAVGTSNVAQTSYIFNGQLIFTASTAAAVTGICNKGAWLSVKFNSKCGTTEHPIYVNFLIKCPTTSPDDPPIISPPVLTQSPPTPGTGGNTGNTGTSRDPTTYGPPPTDCANSAPACTGTCPGGEACTGNTAGGCTCCPSDCVDNCVPPDCNDNNPETTDECISFGGCPAGCPPKKSCVHTPITHPQ